MLKMATLFPQTLSSACYRRPTSEFANTQPGLIHRDWGIKENLVFHIHPRKKSGSVKSGLLGGAG